MIIPTAVTASRRAIERSWCGAIPILVVLSLVALCPAQSARMHRLYRADDPPGKIAFHQRLRGDQCLGEMPWVRLSLPRATIVGVADNSAFVDFDTKLGIVGMPCGQIYRFRLGNIPGLEGIELFPSIEMIDRTSPPPGLEQQFPIIISLDEDDLRAAANGAMVVRVVAIEDPRYPVLLDRASADQQEVFDVASSEDPLHVADEMGRPIAIVRMGAARPASEEPDSNFCFGYPPVSIAVVHDSCRQSFEITDEPDRRPRVAVPDPSWPSVGVDACGNDSNWRPRPDEVICDGGDDGPRARVSASEMHKGLAPTETVASFKTASGETGYTASNRICVYSPRFFATRKITPVAQEEVVLQLAGMDSTTPIAEPSLAVGPVSSRSRLVAHHDIGTKIRHSLQDAQPGLLVDNLKYPEEAGDQQLPYEADQTLPLHMAEAAILPGNVQATQPAVEWTRTQMAEVMLDDQVAFEQKSIRAANEEVVYEAPHGARLQLRKSVTCIEGQLDRVRFTIRFDNVGNETIQDVVINDFLSARLEFLDDTAKCSMKAEVATEADESGARNVQWRIGEPLPAGSGGVIQFECRVR